MLLCISITLKVMHYMNNGDRSTVRVGSIAKYTVHNVEIPLRNPCHAPLNSHTVLVSILYQKELKSASAGDALRFLIIFMTKSTRPNPHDYRQCPSVSAHALIRLDTPSKHLICLIGSATCTPVVKLHVPYIGDGASIALQVAITSFLQDNNQLP